MPPSGHVYTVVDALAAPARFSFAAWSGQATAGEGSALPFTGSLLIRAAANVPPGGTLALIRNGQVIQEAPGPVLKWATDRPGVFRVEARLASAPGYPPVPWIVSNPIYVGVAGESPAAAPPPAGASTPLSGPRGTVSTSELHGHHRHPGSGGNGQERMSFQFTLGREAASSPFAALVTDTTAP